MGVHSQLQCHHVYTYMPSNTRTHVTRTDTWAFIHNSIVNEYTHLNDKKIAFARSQHHVHALVQCELWLDGPFGFHLRISKGDARKQCAAFLGLSTPLIYALPPTECGYQPMGYHTLSLAAKRTVGHRRKRHKSKTYSQLNQARFSKSYWDFGSTASNILRPTGGQTQRQPQRPVLARALVQWTHLALLLGRHHAFVVPCGEWSGLDALWLYFPRLCYFCGKFFHFFADFLLHFLLIFHFLIDFQNVFEDIRPVVTVKIWNFYKRRLGEDFPDILKPTNSRGIACNG